MQLTNRQKAQKPATNEAWTAISTTQLLETNAVRADGEIKLGDVVKLGLHVVDQTKVDGKNINAVVVDITTSGQLRVACRNGVLNKTYALHTVSLLPGLSNDRSLIEGLQEAYESWQGLPKITEREAARVISNVGGQGKKSFKISCNCAGNCATRRCSCKKANVFCNSSCHKCNINCQNHEATEIV